jgi:RibD C-terminal domain
MRSSTRTGATSLKYGTSRFDNTLLRDHLIDEYRFWIMPVVAGAGQRLFEDVDTSGLHLRLTHERRLENGSVILTYAPADLNPWSAGRECRATETHQRGRGDPSRRWSA